MRAVGPRAERPELERAIPFYRLHHPVRPGMAGWALIKHGCSSSVEDARVKLEYDLYYISTNPYLDILLETFVDSATFRGR